MKFLLAVILALGLCPPSNGQFDYKMISSIPFRWEMRDTAFPAGEYDILRGQNVVLRNNDDLRHAGFVNVPLWPLRPNAPNDARLVFNRYGDRYFLSQIWTPNGYYSLLKSRSERELVTSKVVAGVSKPELVIVTIHVTK